MFGRRKQQPAHDVATSDLRDMALGLRPGDLGIEVGTEPDCVYGVLFEMGLDAAFITIVSLLDGTTSMYISHGGGTIGAGEHEVVAQATRAFVATAQQLVDQTERSDQFPPPALDRTRFQLLTVAGGRTVEAATDDLGDNRHALSPLFHAGQDVITQIRLLQESRP